MTKNKYKFVVFHAWTQEGDLHIIRGEKVPVKLHFLSEGLLSIYDRSKEDNK